MQLNTWQAEPIRKAANWLVGISATLLACLVVLNQNIGLVPEPYRTRVSAIAATAGGIILLLSRLAAEVARSHAWAPSSVAALGAGQPPAGTIVVTPPLGAKFSQTP